MTIWRGSREIRILYLGRGHTGGDVVVYLPQERIIVTSDLVGSGLPFLGDAFLDEWAETLEELKKLEFDIILPGHGPAIHSKGAITSQQALLRDFHNQAVALLDAGKSVEEAERLIDLSQHENTYPKLADRRNLELVRMISIGLTRLKTLRDTQA